MAKKTEGDFFNDILEKAGVDIPVSSQVDLYKNITFYDTGSYAFNALLSGSLRGGIASLVTALAGENSTGKTYIALGTIKSFLDADPRSHAFIFDSENDPSKGTDSLVARGLDPDRVHVTFVKTVQDFRNKSNRIINQYLEAPVDKRPPMMFCLDSLGNLSTDKEMKNVDDEKLNEKGEDVKDMTRQSTIKGFFRVLTIKLGEANVPMLMTNHTYETMNPYGESKKMSGGNGLFFCSSTIVYLTKKPFRDEADKKEVLGSILTATLNKSRFTRFGKHVDLLLRHDGGLDRYYGLLDLAENSGILVEGTGLDEKKGGNGIKAHHFKFPDGQIANRKEIESNPVKYFDVPETFEALEQYVNRTFRFGKGEKSPTDDTEDLNTNSDLNNDSDLVSEESSETTSKKKGRNKK